MSHPPRKPPKGLSSAARRFWNQTLTEFEPTNEAQFELLQQLCETKTRLEQIQRAIKAEGCVTKGYRGQPRPHPLLAAEDACRKMLLQLVRALRLASDDEPE